MDAKHEISIHMDFLKFSWDLFIKGNAFYLFAISVMGGFAFSSEVTWFQKMFIGIAITIASGIALFATNIALRFIQKATNKIDFICDRNNLEMLPFEEHVQMVKVFRFISFVLVAVGLLYITHVVMTDGVLPAN